MKLWVKTGQTPLVKSAMVEIKMCSWFYTQKYIKTYLNGDGITFLKINAVHC